MSQALPLTTPDFDVEQEYRAIEATLLESTTGRWFLAEHGRRSRRLDSRMLEDAIGKLQSSLRQPPALLGQLQTEIGELRLYLAQTREELMSRRTDAATAPQVATEAKSETAGKDGAATATAAILRAAEDMHELVWGLQAKEVDPVACEAIAKHASIIYAMSMQQARNSERVLALAAALDQAGGRLAAVLETISHELETDGEPDAEPVAALEPVTSAPSASSPPPLPSFGSLLGSVSPAQPPSSIETDPSKAG
jgi:hypothetical protein